MKRLKALHYDAATGMFLDYGLHTEDVALARPSPDPSAPPGAPPPPLRRVVTGAPPAERLVPAFGYVSLFPLLLELLPADSPELGRQLELLRDEALLWTPYGLRSLARTASLYTQ